ncbi:MAG TPA: hypothetical protein DEA08_34240 [Planctomycetes bacterium]|nr:hypothetical protein [Planctomycetota bacterium]
MSEPLSALDLRPGEEVLWAGRPATFSAHELLELLRLGLGRSAVALLWVLVFGWMSGVTFGVAAIPIGVVLGTLACGYTFARALGSRTQSNGCALTILVVLGPALLATWILVAWRNPKQVFQLLVNPGFVVGSLGVLISAAHVISRILDANTVHYFVTTQRACEVRRLGGEWAVAWVERLRPERCSLRASRGPDSPRGWGDIAFGRGGRHVFRRLEDPERLVASLREGLSEAWRAAWDRPRAGDSTREREADPPPRPEAVSARMPARWAAAIDLGPEEDLLWLGRPGWRLSFELRGLLRGGLTVAGTVLGLLVLLTTPALSQVSRGAALWGLGVSVAVVLLALSLCLLGIALDRLLEDLNRILMIAALAALLVLIPSLVEALWTGRVLALVRDPLAWACLALSVVGAAHVALAIRSRGRVRYVLSSRRAFALDAASGALRWSAVLGGEPRDVRAVPLGSEREEGGEFGHVRFGHGLAAQTFLFVPDPRGLAGRAEAARHWRQVDSSLEPEPPAGPPAGRLEPLAVSASRVSAPALAWRSARRLVRPSPWIERRRARLARHRR